MSDCGHRIEVKPTVVGWERQFAWSCSCGTRGFKPLPRERTARMVATRHQVRECSDKAHAEELRKLQAVKR